MLVVALQWLVMFGLPIIVPEQGGTAMIGGIAGALVVLLWWLFFSRAAWSERLGAIVLMVVAVAVTSRLVHESIANGMMGFMLFLYAVPVLSLALVAWAATSRGLSSGRRRVSMARRNPARVRNVDACPDQRCQLATPFGFRMAVDADGGATASCASRERHRRAAANTPENRTPNQPSEAATTPTRFRQSRRLLRSAACAAAGEEDTAGSLPRWRERARDAAWPGFRGPTRDSVIRGVRIETDWSRTPPVELWRRPIGPGWSSFAVAGDRLFTQEQRGDDEIVSAYNLKTGEPVWRHRDAARFWESNAGAGPRATPTLSNGRVYTLGGNRNPERARRP